MKLQNARVVITGAAGGLGSQLARSFAGSGARLALVDRGRVAEVAELCDIVRVAGAVDALALDADVTDSRAIAELADEIEALWGGTDVLVNNAARNKSIPFADLAALTDDVWDELLHSVLTGPFRCSREFGQRMKSAGGGAIVNISSLAGLAPRGSSIPYAVGKAGLIHLTRCLAVALGPEIRVNSVAPGLMRSTAMGAAMADELTRPIIQESALKSAVSVEDVADMVLSLARSDSTTGQNILVDAGLMFR
jgi:3-oxoacyl-[acyl-carrier protein] reductase